MDASRTHEATHEQSIGSWVLIGAVALTLALAITVGVGMNADDVVEAPAAQVDAGAGSLIGPATRGFEVGRGGLDVAAAQAPGFEDMATGTREGGTYAGAIPIGTPDEFTDVRESGPYYGGQDVTATPRRGPCPVKQGC